ncbi:MAG: hypothetical protein IKU69_05660 [Roseburia sp.]|nr:hypothetical protein [Roseburia sp.]
MSMKNDISFLITDVLNLYEHQSTFNPNLPLRGLLYFANLYRKLVGTRKDLYSAKLIEIPCPQFVVFYNGTKEEPERHELKLSDAFPKVSNKKNAALECTAVVLNINLGYNKVIMERCKKLKEYAQFIAKVRAYLERGYEIENAINKAIEACIKEGILEEILRNHREEVFSMLLTEYDEQAHIENEKEIAYEEGVKEGESRLSKLIQLLVKEKRTEEIEKATSDKEYREKLYKEYNVNYL